MPTAAGHDSRALFLWEDNGYAASPTDSSHKTLGADVTIDTAEFDNSPVNQFDPGSREADTRVAQQFAGSWSASFTLANPWILRMVIASPTSSGSSPTTHTFDGLQPDSFRLILPVEDTGNERILKGCVCSSFTLESADNGEATVSMSGTYADEEETSPGTGSIQSQVSESFDPLMFGDGTLTLDSTTFDLVQNVSLSIENNIDIIYELGSRVGVDYSPKVRATTLEFGKIVENDDQLTTAYGGSGSTTPQSRVDDDDEFSGSLVFDNGETGSDQNKITFNFAGAFPDGYGRSGTGDPSADYIEDVSDYVREIDATATNDTSSAP